MGGSGWEGGTNCFGLLLVWEIAETITLKFLGYGLSSLQKQWPHFQGNKADTLGGYVL